MSSADPAPRRERDEDGAGRFGAGSLLRAALATAALLLALLFLVMLNRSFGLLRWPGGTWAAPTRELILGAPTARSDVARGASFTQGGPMPDTAVRGPQTGSSPAISPTFEGFYAGYGGERALGLPISSAEWLNGREIQWFERARLEHWPEHAGTPYEVQLGLLGVEYTAGRSFARQAPFVSTPELRYFPETGHAVGGAFLRFWEQSGGLASLGLPISEEFDEVQSDGVAYRVQYFERARLEHHPRHAGTPYEVQLGLLGAALLRNDARPTTVQPVPTAVPMP